MPVLILLPSISPIVARIANFMKLAVNARSVLNQTKNSYNGRERKKGTKRPVKTRVKIISVRFMVNWDLRFTDVSAWRCICDSRIKICHYAHLQEDVRSANFDLL